MRRKRLKSYQIKGDKNSLHYWWKIKNPFRVSCNFIIISLCRILPSLQLKIFLLSLIGVNLGKNVAFGLMSIVDIFFPELISIGENSIIGFNTVLLGHEFLINEYRTGPVIIGQNVMIGANCTILPGVVIGDGAIIGAGTVVYRDVAPGAFIIGVQMTARGVKDNE